MSIPGSVNPLFLGAAGQATGGGGYLIERSVRFNSPDSAYLSRTPASSGNRKTWTYSFWFKLGSVTGYQYFLSGDDPTGSTFDLLQMDYNASTIAFMGYSGSYDWLLSPDVVFRDPSAWQHFVIAFDTTQSTASNRVKWWHNGNQLNLNRSGYTTYPLLNHESRINNTVTQRLSDQTYGLNSYLADIHFIDGQALDPSSFGEFDTNGVWQPIDASGLTYGTNGFRLPFSDNSTAAALGTDTSSNGNTWTVNNITATTTSYTTTNSITSSGGLNNPQRILDGTVDADATIPTGAAWIEFTPPVGISYSSSVEVMGSGSPNPPYNARWQLNGGSLINTVNANSWVTLATGSGTIAKIRLQADQSGLNWRGIRVDGVILKEEAGPGIDSLVDSPTNYGTGNSGGDVRGNYCTWNPLFTNSAFSISNGNLDLTTSSVYNTICASTFGLSSGKWYWEITINSGAGAGIGVCTSAVNLANFLGGTSASRSYDWTGQKYPGGASYGASYTVGDIIGVAIDVDAGTLVYYKNGVSQGTAFTDLAGSTWFPAIGDQGAGADVVISANFGQRPFAYPLSGFKALCTTNLPEPTIADGSQYFQVIKYPGNGTTQTLPNINSEPSSGLNFSPDLVWIKRRDGTAWHFLFDTIRGTNKSLFSNDALYEVNYGSDYLDGFTSDGFTLGSNADLNGSGRTFVAWTWDAGSSTVSNTEGSITSQVRANASAGFSVVTYTGNDTSGASFGHGLGVAPHMVIVKTRGVVGRVDGLAPISICF
jgi:hypothetical protein